MTRLPLQPDELPCECPGPGYCPRYKIEQTEYAHSVCANKPVEGWIVNKGKSMAYRKRWRVKLMQREGQLPPALTPPAHVADAPRPAPTRTRPTVPTEGPGTELKAIFDGMGIKGWAGCGCKDLADTMNALGPDGCDEPGNRKRIIEQLRNNAKRLNLLAKLQAGWGILKCITTGVSPVSTLTDPTEGLLDLAIRRAREKLGKETHHENSTVGTGGPAGGGPTVDGPPAAGRPDRTQDGTGAGADGVRDGTPVGAKPDRVPPVRIKPDRPDPGRRRSRAPGEPDSVAFPKGTIGWVVGVTTVPKRRHDLLPRTLESLRRGGFHSPRLFVDDCDLLTAAWYADTFGLPVTARHPKVGAYANWGLALAELFLREPGAARFVLFQDDVVVCKNLRPYLDSIPYPAGGYLNLSTIQENEKLARPGTPPGVVMATEDPDKRKLPVGSRPQRGRGAMGLVFDRAAVLALLQHPHLSNRVLPERRDPDRYFRFIDGAVVEAMNNVGFREYIHTPCLLQHNGPASTLTDRKWGPESLARSWPGEQFDCLTLLPAG